MEKTTKRVYAASRDQWREWLAKNHKAKKEVWLIYYKKHTDKPRIPYDDAVEEAICFGWIDSTVKRLDEEKYAQKFTPRSAKSKWSQLNIQRAKRMIEEGRMTEAGLVKCQDAIKNSKKEPRTKPSKKRLTIPPYLKEALSVNKKVWENFNNLAPSYQRLYIGWIADAKKEETRKKRLKEAMILLKQNKKLGMK
jgi:uncharacterized protein YdeI (YjbR/CyaY-like superfamily)